MQSHFLVAMTLGVHLLTTSLLANPLDPADKAKDATDSLLSRPGVLLQRAYLKQAEQGDASAQFYLGSLFFTGENGATVNPSEGEKWLTKSAEQDYSKAQLVLGLGFTGGMYAETNHAEGVRWLNKAVIVKKGKFANNLNSNDLALAHSTLGRTYLFGRGVESDPKESFSHFLRAAECGHIESQAQVGLFYSLGIGTEPNPKQAIQWTEKAAQRGSYRALATLGNMYKDGKIVPQNFVEAHKWFSLATVVGNREVDPNDKAQMILVGGFQRTRDQIAEKMTREQIAEAQKSAQEYLLKMSKKDSQPK